MIYHGVEVFTGRRSRRKILVDGRATMLRLLADFRPHMVVMEKILFANNQRTAILTVCGNGHAGKSEVARSVVAHFPELAAYLRQDRKWKDRFQANRFGAVAVGLSAYGARCRKS